MYYKMLYDVKYPMMDGKQNCSNCCNKHINYHLTAYHCKVDQAQTAVIAELQKN